MPGLLLKSDSSFFDKIVLGAVGARAVAADLSALGHDAVELERGATDTKIWKDVKRKRVRIPDLVCTRCGRRIECRAKTSRELTMSHSTADHERGWDYGLVNDDWVAFPVCEDSRLESVSAGRLRADASSWRETEWVRWEPRGDINYLEVAALRAVPFESGGRKGVTEGSEATVRWSGQFSSREGRVLQAARDGVRVAIGESARPHTWKLGPGQTPQVEAGEWVRANRLLACCAPVLRRPAMVCPQDLSAEKVGQLLRSVERTQRFTGVKLARLLGLEGLADEVARLATDAEEDIYVRVEGAAYRLVVARAAAAACFSQFLRSNDPQTRLEAVIALGDSRSGRAVTTLEGIMHNQDQEPFMRTAAAWALGQVPTDDARNALVQGFAATDLRVRREALESLVGMGEATTAALLAGLSRGGDDVAAGCAEVLRQLEPAPQVVEAVGRLVGTQAVAELNTRWMVWLLGNTDPQLGAPVAARLAESRPELHYAITVLWAFLRSWVSRNWQSTLHPEG